MKQMKLAICMIAIILACLSATSCSSDGPGDNSAVVGTWYGDDYDHFYSNVKLTFNSDGTGSGSIERNGTYISVYRMAFTYKVKGSKVTTKGTRSNANSDGETSITDFNITFELSGNKLYVKDGDKWYKNAVTSFKK